MTATVDDRGRVLIPHELRDRLGLRPGAHVRVRGRRDCVEIRVVTPCSESLRELVGAINAHSLPRGATELDRRTLKRLWEPRP